MSTSSPDGCDGSPGIISMSPQQAVTNPAPANSRASLIGTLKPVGRPLSCASWLSESAVLAERERGLGHAHGQMTVTEPFELVQLLPRLAGVVDAVPPVDARGDGLDAFLERSVLGGQEGEVWPCSSAARMGLKPSRRRKVPA